MNLVGMFGIACCLTMVLAQPPFLSYLSTFQMDSKHEKNLTKHLTTDNQFVPAEIKKYICNWIYLNIVDPSFSLATVRV